MDQFYSFQCWLVSINDNYKYRVKSCIQVRESARRFDQLLLLYDDVGPESDWGRDTEISCDLVSVRKHITIHCSSGRCLRAFQGLAGSRRGASPFVSFFHVSRTHLVIVEVP